MRPSRSNTGSPSSSASTSTPGPDLAHPWCADEDAAERPLAVREVQVGLEARNLAAVGIPLHLEIDEAEVTPVEHDHPRTGPEHRAVERADRVVDPVERRELRDRRRLAARDHEPVEAVELLRQAHFDGIRAGPAQRAHVVAKRPLQRQDPDLRPRLHGVSVDRGS